MDIRILINSIGMLLLAPALPALVRLSMAMERAVEGFATVLITSIGMLLLAPALIALTDT